MKYISVVAIIAVLLIPGYILYQYSYGWIFGDYQEKYDSYCLVEKAGIALNKVYKISDRYPDRENWVKSISTVLSEASCGYEIKVVDGKLLDNFNDPICYNRVSDNKVFIYSISTFLPGVYKSYIGYKLLDGDIHYLYIDGDTVCNTDIVEEPSLNNLINATPGGARH